MEITCPVCLDPIIADNETATVKFPGCQHAMHTQCALQCAWKGIINCPTCRRLPIPTMDQYDVEDNQSQSIYEHNKAEMQKYFRKGLAVARTKKASSNLKKAVEAYKKYNETKKQKVQEQMYYSKIHRELKSDINASVVKLKSKYAAKVDAAGYKGKACVNMLSVQPNVKKMSRRSRDHSRSCLGNPGYA